MRFTRLTSRVSSASGKSSSMTRAYGFPADLDYASIPGLSNEMVERLETARPETLDQAARVPASRRRRCRRSIVAASRRAAA